MGKEAVLSVEGQRFKADEKRMSLRAENAPESR